MEEEILDNPFDRAAKSQEAALAYLKTLSESPASDASGVSAQLPPVTVDPAQAVQQIQQLAASFSATPDHAEDHHFEGGQI